MQDTDNTTINDVASEADQIDFDDLSDEALDRPPESGGGEFTACIGPSCKATSIGR